MIDTSGKSVPVEARFLIDKYNINKIAKLYLLFINSCYNGKYESRCLLWENVLEELKQYRSQLS